MSESTLQLAPRLQAYLHDVSLREPAACRQLRERTHELDDAGMISSPEQTQLLSLIAGLMGAYRILEVGTFTGYTSLWLALSLPPESRLICLDRDAEATAIAREAWTAAGVADRIDLRIGDAADGLAGLFDDGEASSFDLAYIDADKERQTDYYDACLKLVRPGGLVAIDNTLWKGQVADPAVTDDLTRAVRRFNETVHADERVDVSLVPIGDGLTLARKRE